VRLRPRLMHDGASDAIQRHCGEVFGTAFRFKGKRPADTALTPVG